MSAGPIYPLLKDVSRSFYLTLRVLPSAIRVQIGLAYLLARTTDTIADTDLVPVAERLAALDRLRARVLGTTATPLDLARFTDGSPDSATPAERLLLRRVESAVSELERFSVPDRQLIRQVLSVITGGQELDLRRFATASESAIVALRTDAELDDYTYRVAGCVGEFWTRMCRVHLFPAAPLDDDALLANGVSFGKGLQLVNVLRDLPKDLRLGRCYLPADRLAAAGLGPAALLEARNLEAFRPLYTTYLNLAEQRLADGWAYTNALPAGQVRVRLACAWPLLIGMQTLGRLRAGNVLDAGRRIKISRTEVRQLILRSLICYPFPRAWDRLFTRATTVALPTAGGVEPNVGKGA